MVPPDCPGSWLRLTDADQAPAIGPAFSQEQRLFSTDLSGCPHPSGFAVTHVTGMNLGKMEAPSGFEPEMEVLQTTREDSRR